MRRGVIVSLLLHALALTPLLLIYAPRLGAPLARETAPQTRFVAQTVNIESLRPTPPPTPVTAEAPPVEAPKPVVSKAEQAETVPPAQPKAVKTSKPEPPLEPEAAPEPKPAPPPEPERTKPDPKPAPRAEPPPEPEPPPQPESPPAQKALAEKEPPAAKQPPAQDQRLAMMNDAPASSVPSSASQAAATAGESAESDVDYLTRIRALIEQQKRYPPMALRLGMEGEVRLWFVLNRQGRVLDYRIDQGSGHAMLDEEVERLIQQIAAFPPVPPDMSADRLELIVPISFHLAG